MGSRQRRSAQIQARKEQRPRSNSDENPPAPRRPKQTSTRHFQSAAFATALVAVVAGAYLRLAAAPPPMLRPFHGPKLTQLPQFHQGYLDRMLWGTYRPGLYFGLRTRLPSSLLVGLMWVDPSSQNALESIRHEAQQGDGLKKYGWAVHDGETYARQELLDGALNITTTWVKRMDLSSNDTARGGDISFPFVSAPCLLGRDWGARVTAERLRGEEGEGGGAGAEQLAAVSLILYVASEDGSPVTLDPRAAAAALTPGKRAAATVAAARRAFTGQTALPVGRWGMYLHGSSGGRVAPAVHHFSLKTPHLHNLTAAVRRAFVESLLSQQAAGARQYALTLPGTADPGSNVAALQITAPLPFAFDLGFLGGVAEAPAAGSPTEFAERWAVGEVTGAGLRKRFGQGEEDFEWQFKDAFGELGAAGLPEGTAAVAKAAVSNLLGGMGYWHGHSLVKLPAPDPRSRRRPPATDRPARLRDAPLFSATPSRSFFPRGFLWDEGFHQLLVRRWDPRLSRDALAHWLDLMTGRGWIPREQILGAEARARVPDEFVLQSPDAANPPTLFLALSDMAHRAADAAASMATNAAARAASGASADPDDDEFEPDAVWVDPVGKLDLEFLKAAWPRLVVWFRWYNSTQAGPLPGSYRWRGRDAGAVRELNPKTLTSGLDDFPRASHPSEEERHVDLRCWMALAARAMATIGGAVRAPAAELAAFSAAAAQLEDFSELLALHWDEAAGQFRDWGSHTEDVDLRSPAPTDGGNDGGGGLDVEPRRVVTGEPPRPRFVPHYGYPSLMPLIMGLIPPDAPQLGQQIRLLQDPARLWTPHGLRSLSADSSLYQRRNTPHDPPYWRGAVWVNINHLALRALQRYAAGGGPYAAQAGAAAAKLCSTLLTNLVGQYNSTGYLWEQYDDSTGAGKGSHPFTGWTALLALAAADKKPEKGAWADAVAWRPS